MISPSVSTQLHRPLKGLPTNVTLARAHCKVSSLYVLDERRVAAQPSATDVTGDALPRRCARARLIHKSLTQVLQRSFQALIL